MNFFEVTIFVLIIGFIVMELSIIFIISIEKGEVMKAKELLNQTDVDFKCFSEHWEKAHQHVR